MDSPFLRPKTPWNSQFKEWKVLSGMLELVRSNHHLKRFVVAHLEKQLRPLKQMLPDFCPIILELAIWSMRHHLCSDSTALLAVVQETPGVGAEMKDETWKMMHDNDMFGEVSGFQSPTRKYGFSQAVVTTASSLCQVRIWISSSVWYSKRCISGYVPREPTAESEKGFGRCEHDSGCNRSRRMPQHLCPCS